MIPAWGVRISEWAFQATSELRFVLEKVFLMIRILHVCEFRKNRVLGYNLSEVCNYCMLSSTDNSAVS